MRTINLNLFLLFLIPIASLADEQTCRKQAEASYEVCSQATANLKSIDAQVVQFAAAAGAPDTMSESVNMQATALRANVTGATPQVEACQSAASACEQECDDQEVCKAVKVQAMSMTMQLGQLRSQLASTEDLAKTTNIQKADASNPSVIPITTLPNGTVKAGPTIPLSQLPDYSKEMKDKYGVGARTRSL